MSQSVMSDIGFQSSFDVLMPSSREEQRAIGALFARLDSLITLHQRKQGSAVVLSSCLGTA